MNRAMLLERSTMVERSTSPGLVEGVESGHIELL